MDLSEISDMSFRMRRTILDVSHQCGLSTHLGGGLSMVEVMASLYGRVLNFDPENTTWVERDRFVLSKGHGVLGLFSALHEVGLISEVDLVTFQKNASDLIAHPVMNLGLGIESSNGSLGHGLALGVGMALSGKKLERQFTTFVLMGDGECNEGSVWEAVMSAAHFRLDNLVAIVDYNKLQSDGKSSEIMNMGDLAEKFISFGWDTEEIDGHSVAEIVAALEKPRRTDMPAALIAHTVKGNGISFMENDNSWHHARLTKLNYELAIEEVNSKQKLGGLRHV